MPPQIRRIAQTYLQDPVEVTIAAKTTTSANIRQRYWWVSGMHKLDALTRILEVEPFDAMIIFARTKAGTEELASKQARGLAAAAINGDMQQAQRERTIAMLKEGKLDILVTDARPGRGAHQPRAELRHPVRHRKLRAPHRPYRSCREAAARRSCSRPRVKGMLRQIERATRQPIEEMAAERKRQRHPHQQVHLAHRETLGAVAWTSTASCWSAENEQNVPAIEIAAALARMLQGDTSFLLPPVRTREERAPRERFDRGDRPERGDRFDRNERGPRFERGPRRDDAEGGFEQRPRREVPPRGAPEQGMETYRISVGHQHGVKPANIVGAIANEAGLKAASSAASISTTTSLLDLPGTDAAGRAVAPAEGGVRQQLQMRALARVKKPTRPCVRSPRFDKRARATARVVVARVVRWPWWRPRR